MEVKDILKEMTAPYVAECRYLKEAEVNHPVARGRFEIPKPFYCVSTGHFNAVEAVICYNQLAYTAFATFFENGAIEQAGRIPLEGFKKLQAGSSYIARVSDMTFRRPIDASNFWGEFEISKVAKRKNTIFFYTDFNFGDDNRGAADGKALLALSLEGMCL